MICPNCSGKLEVFLGYNSDVLLACQDCDIYVVDMYGSKLYNYLGNRVNEVVAELKQEDFFNKDGTLIPVKKP